MGHCWCSWCKLLYGCVCWGLDQASKYICWLKNANLWHTEFAEWKLSTTTFCRARGMTMHLSSRARLLYMDSLWRTSQNYQRWLGAVWLRLAGKSNFVILRRSTNDLTELHSYTPYFIDFKNTGNFWYIFYRWTFRAVKFNWLFTDNS